jgi:lipopolysaccharide/colanic/teichoic acid biosynthesis glycosyltransferase
MAEPAPDDWPEIAELPLNRRGSAKAAKRALDLVGSACGLIVLAPFLVAVALLIRVVDGSPVLFWQSRAGVGGRPFEILKFRTMARGADAQRPMLRLLNEVSGNASFKLANDPRTTRLGRILRKTSIDELPQLWNVLKGDMSLVGPRPHPFDDVAGYAEWHVRRLDVKPGITGLWQVTARADHSFDRWVELDLEYIDNWSFGLDLRLLIRTIPAVLRREGR